MIYPQNSEAIPEALNKLLSSVPPGERGGFVIFQCRRDLDFVQYSLEPNGLMLFWPFQAGGKERLQHVESCLIEQGYSCALHLPDVDDLEKKQYMILDDGLYGQAGRDVEELANLTFYLMDSIFDISAKDIVSITLEHDEPPITTQSIGDIKIRDLTIRASFLAEKITFYIEKILDEAAQHSSDKNKGNNKKYLPVSIIVLAYCQYLGAFSNSKLNLFALKRLFAQCGYKPSISQDELASLVAKTCDQIGPFASSENIENELSKYGHRIEDPIELLSKNVTSLHPEEIEYRLKEPEIMNKAKEIIAKHSTILKRKRTQLLLYDDYGIPDTRKWREEQVYFIKNVLLPNIGEENLKMTTHNKIAELLEDLCRDVIPQAQLEQSSENLPELTPIEFESRCSDVLKKQGWETRLTKSTGDQGVDIIAKRNGITVVFQCKLYSNPVGNKAVQEVHSGKDFIKADLGIVVSNAEFTPSARELAASLNVILLHHNQLEELDRALILNAQRKS